MESICPSTLLYLSAEIVCKDVSSQVEKLSILPWNLKSQLLKLMSKRGTLDATSLRYLLSRYEKYLNLSESYLDDECLVAARACPYLKELNLNPGKNQVHTFTSKALLGLFPCLTRLSRLSLQQCPAVCDEVMESVSKNCTSLILLDVSGCIALTDKSLKSVAEGLSKLITLNISQSQITDVGLVFLSQGRSQHCLTELDVSGCLRISGKGVASILGSCSRMKYFFFHGCPVSENVVPFLDLSLQRGMRQISWTVY